MRSDPEPMDSTRYREAQCPVIETNADAVELAVADTFELQRRVRWIYL